VDLSALASRTVAEIQSTTDRHVLDLAIEGKVTGFWDERRLVQVLENLLTNAIKYSPNGGCVRVSMHGDEDTVKVAVTDEGIGLTPEEAEHVFERYFRAHSSRRLEGSGLGLYICQSIVAAHGGQIWAESPGRNCGSSFIFELSRGEPRSDD
jgi:signal transduction histidine kinase